MSRIPKISVCIPAFNSANYIVQAVESLWTQTYKDFEIIIVDDCSGDQTLALVRNLQKMSSQCLRVYSNDHNIGLSKNSNRCIEYARGMYIKFLHADDLLLPTCLERMLTALEKYENVELVCSNRLTIDHAGQALSKYKFWLDDKILSGTKAIQLCLFGKNYIGEPTAVMFRNKRGASLFSVDMSQLMDMDLWFRLLEQGDLFSIKDPLCVIRRHSQQLSKKNIYSKIPIEERMRLLSRFALKTHGVSNLIRLKSLFHMSYRVYLYRNYLSEERKQEILSLWGNRFLYSLMFVWGPIEKYLIKSPKYNN
ncbi:MAG: glycosyltransferase family 2 protein [Nitrosospira sp.]|nr:glycosyltransferase family 2 protein [Nitrosospira sp.]